MGLTWNCISKEQKVVLVQRISAQDDNFWGKLMFVKENIITILQEHYLSIQSLGQL